MIYTAKNTFEIGRPIRHFTDGDNVEHIAYFLFADTETGEVLRQVRIDGELQIDYDTGDVKMESVFLPPPLIPTFFDGSNQ